MESCASATLAASGSGPARTTYVLVGAPNVGKSVVFHRLTGTYANVSNYPGTTVEVARAPLRFEAGAMLLDTPGVLAFPSRSGDERAAMHAPLVERPRALVQVADAKHLRRSLAITLTLAETGLPLVLALNMSDEAAAHGVRLDLPALAQALGIDVVATMELKEQIILPIELQLGRRRSENKFAPRTMDIDIILFDGKSCDDKSWEKAFVVVPLAEIFPSYQNLLRNESIQATANRLLQQTWMQIRPEVLSRFNGAASGLQSEAV